MTIQCDITFVLTLYGARSLTLCNTVVNESCACACVAALLNGGVIAEYVRQMIVN